MDRDGAAGVGPEMGAADAPDIPAFRAQAFRPWRDGALIAMAWVVLAAFVFVPAFQILGLLLIPVIATLLVRGGGGAAA